MAIDEPIKTVLIVSGSVLGGVLLIVIVFLTYKLCSAPKEKNYGKKKRRQKEGHANGAVYGAPRHGPRGPPLPAGIWTSNPTMYAGSPAGAYSGVVNPVGKPNGIPHHAIERNFTSEPNLNNEPFLRRTVRRAQSMLKQLPAVFQVKRAAAKSAAKMPPIPETIMPKPERRQEDKQSELMMTEETAPEPPEGEAPRALTAKEKENTTARVFSDYTLQTLELERQNTAKIFSTYTDPVHILATDETGENVAFAQSLTTHNQRQRQNNAGNQQRPTSNVAIHGVVGITGPREGASMQPNGYGGNRPPSQPVMRAQSFLAPPRADAHGRHGKYVNRASSFQAIDKLKMNQNNMHLYRPAVLGGPDPQRKGKGKAKDEKKNKNDPIRSNFVMRPPSNEPLPVPVQHLQSAPPHTSRPLSMQDPYLATAPEYPIMRSHSDLGQPAINHFSGPKDPFAIYARPSKIKRATREENLVTEHPRQQIPETPTSPTPPPVPPPAPHSPITEELPRGGAVINGIPQSEDEHDGNTMTTEAVIENHIEVPEDASDYDYPDPIEEDSSPKDIYNRPRQQIPNGVPVHLKDSPRELLPPENHTERGLSDIKSLSSVGTGSLTYSRTGKQEVADAFKFLEDFDDAMSFGDEIEVDADDPGR